MPTMPMRQIGGVYWATAGETDIADVEWGEWLDHIRKEGKPPYRILVRTLGAAPSGGQRQRLRGVLAGQKLTLAVMTDNRWARGILQVIGLIPGITAQGFQLDGMESALEFLQVGAQERSNWGNRSSL